MDGWMDGWMDGSCLYVGMSVALAKSVVLTAHRRTSREADPPTSSPPGLLTLSQCRSGAIG